MLMPFIAAICGFLAGIVVGGLAEALIVPLALLATGHAHPLAVLDESFRSRPLGALAFVMIAGYFATAFLGAMAAYKTARRLSPDWNPPVPASVAPLLKNARKLWRKTDRRTKTLLVALPILSLALQTIAVREWQAALAHSTSRAAPGKSAPLRDHGQIRYATAREKRMIFRWEVASCLVTIGTLAYVFHVFRLKDLVLKTIGARSGSRKYLSR
jgi:hypothetical protein